LSFSFSSAGWLPASASGQELAEKTHCDVCGEFVCMDLDIFGNESGEGRVVDGVVVCSACLEKEECEE